MAKPNIAIQSFVHVTTTGPTYTAAPTWTPGANSLLVAFVVGCAVSPSDPTGVTGHGQTYTKLPIPTATLSSTHIMSIWVANAGPSPTSVAEVASFGGSPTGCSLFGVEITGWPIAEQTINAFGTNINTATAASGTTATVNHDLRPDVTSEHVEISFFLHLANETTTERAGWTGFAGNFNNPATGVQLQVRLASPLDLISSATWSTSSFWRGLALLVRGTATTPTENPKISDTVTAFLVVSNDLDATVGSDALKITDAVTPQLTPLERSATEALRITDTVSAQLTPLEQSVTDTLKISETLSALLIANLDAPIANEALTVTDTVAAQLTPLQSSANESLRLADAVTAQLTLLERAATEALRVTDTLSAQFTPLEQIATEALKVTDTVTAVRGGDGDLSASIGDALRISDPGRIDVWGVLHITDGPVAAGMPFIEENLRLSDAIAARLNPDPVSITDTIRISDGPVITDLGGALTALVGESFRISDPGRIDVWGVLHITDGPVVATILAAGDLAVAIADENLKLADSVSVQLTPLQQTIAESLRITDAVIAQLTPLQRTATEALRITDTVLAQLTPLEQIVGESLRISDGPVLADLNPRPVLLAQEAIKISDGPVLAELTTGVLTAAADENLKLSDLITAQLTPLQQSATENLRITDTVTAQLTPLQQTASENLRLSDGPVIAALDLSAAVAEAVRISDSVTADENPRPVLIDAENLKISDGPVATGAGLSQIAGPEALRITEVLQAELTLLQTATPAESLRISDAVSAELTPLVQMLSEAIRITDGPVLASIGLSVAITDDALRITDTVTADENPRPVLVAQEAIRITDTPTVVISGNLIAPIASENLKLSDLITAQLTPLQVAIPAENLKISDAAIATRQQAATVADETLRITDSVTAALGHLEAAPATEQIRISDLLTASLTLLQVSLAETVYISDAVLIAVVVSALPATPDLVELDATIRRTVTLDATLERTVTIDATLETIVTVDTER